MILPMTVFFFVLALSGGLIVLLGGFYARAAGQAPLAFSMLFAGLGYCGLALVLYPLAFYSGTVTGFVLLFFVPFAGGLGGAMFGRRKSLKRAATARA